MKKKKKKMENLKEFPQIEVKDKNIYTINYIPIFAIEKNYEGALEIGQTIKILKLFFGVYRKKFDNINYY